MLALSVELFDLKKVLIQGKFFFQTRDSLLLNTYCLELVCSIN